MAEPKDAQPGCGEMQQRVADAIEAAINNSERGLGEDQIRLLYRDAALAAMLALREPNGAMQEAGDLAGLAGAIIMEADGETITHTPALTWVAMMDAAIAPPTGRMSLNPALNTDRIN